LFAELDIPLGLVALGQSVGQFHAFGRTAELDGLDEAGRDHIAGRAPLGPVAAVALKQLQRVAERGPPQAIRPFLGTGHALGVDVDLAGKALVVEAGLRPAMGRAA
jgi:hypothetical protein